MEQHGPRGTYIDVHLFVQAVANQQVVGHPYPMRLHRMALSIVVVANVLWIAAAMHPIHKRDV